MGIFALTKSVCLPLLETLNKRCTTDNPKKTSTSIDALYPPLPQCSAPIHHWHCGPRSPPCPPPPPPECCPPPRPQCGTQNGCCTPRSTQCNLQLLHWPQKYQSEHGQSIKLDTQALWSNMIPKRSCHLDFLAKISVRHQDKMIACSFETSLRGSCVSTGGQ